MSEYKTEKIFVDGLFIKDRTEKTPEFILASYSINIEKFFDFLQTNQDKAVKGWLNIDIKKSKDGKKYAELNTYQDKAQTDTRFQFTKEEKDLPIVDVNADMPSVSCEVCTSPGVVANDGHDCIPF